MDENLEKRFLKELEIQCGFAKFALEDLNSCLSSLENVRGGFTNNGNNDVERLWYSIQNFLNAAANISRILWPSKRNYKERGRLLRKKLNVNDGFALNSRQARNSFEHFDERLHDWFFSLDKPSAAVDRNIGPIDSWNPSGDPDKKYFLRNFDQTKYVLWFRGEMYELQPMIKEIQSIFNLVSCHPSRVG